MGAGGEEEGHMGDTAGLLRPLRGAASPDTAWHRSVWGSREGLE